MIPTRERVPHPWLAGRRAAITTQHGKERQFGPALRDRADITLEVATFDTDLLGTFTGTIARTRSPRDTALRKAELAVEITGCPIGLGSEGSFGPHPALLFVPSALEIVVLVDVENDLEIIASLLTPNTNHAQLAVDEPVVPAEFLSRVGYPEHALIVTPGGTNEPAATAIRDDDALRAALRHSLNHASTAMITTDLRAHLNPTRQGTLVELADRLVDRLQSSCPACDAPGWGVTTQETGRPCAECDTPTELVAADIWTCASRRCTHTDRRRRDDLADPASCPTCNP